MFLRFLHIYVWLLIVDHAFSAMLVDNVPCSHRPTGGKESVARLRDHRLIMDNETMVIRHIVN